MSGQTKLLLPSGGSITIAGQNSASNFVATLPANTGTVVTTGSTAAVSQAMLGAGVAGNGPAFSAYASSGQAIPNATFTKVQLQTEEFDTASAFDSTTNYRFQPSVAGYYQINGSTAFATNSCSVLLTSIYKNGTEYKRGNAFTASTAVGGGAGVCSLLYLNGTTDYIELWAYQVSGASNTTSTSVVFTYFNGSLVRSA